MQLVIVGTVGTDHPCQAECSITAIDLAFFESDVDGNPKMTKKPKDGVPFDEDDAGTYDLQPHYAALVKLPLDPQRTFQWRENETSVLTFDIRGEQIPVSFFANSTYW